MTVAELGDRMSSREFSEWIAYYRIEPFGEERADFRQALTTSAVHNGIQAQAKTPQWTSYADFMLFSEVADTESAKPSDAPTDAGLLREKFMALTGGGKTE